MDARNDNIMEERKDDVMSQMREKQGTRGQGQERSPQQTTKGSANQERPLKNASELGEHSSTDQLNLQERLELPHTTVHHVAHVESKVIDPPSTAIIEESHAGDDKNKAAGKFGHRSLAGEKKSLSIKPITVQIFQIPEQLQERRTVEAAATPEELKGRAPHQGPVASLGLGLKGSPKQFHP